MEARIKVVYDSSNLILIEDLCNEYNTKSVTNDAEAVVSFLHETLNLHKSKKIYYIDTSGNVDQLCHDGQGNFTDFAFGFKDVESFKEFYKI